MDRVKSRLKIQLGFSLPVTCFIEVQCSLCKQPFVKKNGFSRKGQQRYLCCNDQCSIKSFMLEYHYQACIPDIKKQVVDMAINGCGIRDTTRILKISKSSVIKVLKSKEACLVQVNPNIKTMVFSEESEVSFKLVCDEAEIDEQWSFVGNKSNQRWLWYAIDHVTGTILAYVFGKRKDIVFKKLKALLEPFSIQRFFHG